MTREMFTRMVAVTIRRSPAAATPEQLAELIAQKMEELAELLGDETHRPQVDPPAPRQRSADQPPARTAWPAVNPEAIEPVVEAPSGSEPPMVVLATSIPDATGPIGKALANKPKPKAQEAKLSVPALNLLVQNSTPMEISVLVSNPAGEPLKVVLRREVYSEPVAECVKLVYAHQKSDDIAVQAVMSVEDGEYDFDGIVKKLSSDAANMCRVRGGPIVSVPPRVGLDPVVSNYNDSKIRPEDLEQVSGLFRTTGSAT